MAKKRRKKIGRITNAKEAIISNKIDQILREGIRRNTRKPVSKSNPRRKVSQAQAVAIAHSMYERSHRRS